MTNLLKDYIKLQTQLTEAIDYLGESKLDIEHETFYKIDGLIYDELEEKFSELESWVAHKEIEAGELSSRNSQGEIADHQIAHGLSVL